LDDQDFNNMRMRSHHGDHFGFPDTDTSILSSLPGPLGDLDDSLSSSMNGYPMGPVLKAMLEEWSMGDELLSKKKRKRKTSREQHNE
jgi:hypothetical protein